MSRLQILVIVLQYFYCSSVIAFEPPRESLNEAFSKGKTAFLARAIKTEQLERKKYSVIGSVTLELRHCFYGVKCEKGKIVSLKYHVQTTKESTLPVQFPLSTDLIFIMNQDLIEGGYFDSEWPGGIDRVFICDNFPFDFLNSTEKVRCENIYGGKKPSWVKWSELITLKE